MKLELIRVAIPDRATVSSAVDYRDMVDVANTVAFVLWKNSDFVYTPEDELATFSPSPFHDRFVYLARLDTLPVGRVVVSFPLEEDATTADLDVAVVPGARGRGIGSALLKRGEELAAEGGRIDFSLYSEVPIGVVTPAMSTVAAAAGARGMPADDAGTRFALDHGYTLGQVEVMSQLELPIDGDRESSLARDAGAHAGDYHLVHWWKHTPPEFADSFAALRARMVMDVPHEGIALNPEHWDAARVHAEDRRMIDKGEPLLTSAAVHTSTGELVAYTSVAVAGGSDKVEQHDTLVAAAHRGHRLGLLVKLANLRELAAVAPGARRILTWNADENGHMRSINHALGFRETGLVGNWQKSLPA